MRLTDIIKGIMVTDPEMCATAIFRASCGECDMAEAVAERAKKLRKPLGFVICGSINRDGEFESGAEDIKNLTNWVNDHLGDKIRITYEVLEDGE